MLLRRAATTSAVAVLLLTGCSGSDGEQSEGAGGTRTVATEYGDVEVPTDPQRVVVLNYALAGYLYDLDVPVVATTPEDADQEEGAYSEFWAEDAEEDGTIFLPWTVDGYDLESVLEADPDLIIGGGLGFPLGQAEAVYDDLGEIAPTVLVDGGKETWQDQFSFLAEDVLDRADDYQERVDAHQERVDEVREAITPPPGPVSLVSFTAEQEPYVLIEDRGLPLELEAVGIDVAPLFAENDFEAYASAGDLFTLSSEQVGQTLTTPSMFVMGFNGETADVESLSQNPVYTALPAFQDDQAFDLPYWALRGDYDETMAVLDLLEEQFS